MDRTAALSFLHEKMQSTNLRRHCYAVEAVMRSLAEHFGEDPEKWGIAGLLHDADYEITKDNPKAHTHLVLEWLSKHEISEDIKNAILAHGWEYVEGNPEPSNKMEWSLYCCDELTGLIVACALVKPDRKLASVTLDTIMGKWKQKSFAAGVNRAQIAKCEDTLGIKLEDFIKMALSSMQAISSELGL